MERRVMVEVRKAAGRRVAWMTRRTMLPLFVAALLATPTFASDDEKRPSKSKSPPKPLEIGDRAVDFDLPGVDGKRHRLRDFDDAKVLVIVFTCNHCPTAQLYEERIQKLARDYRKQGVTLVAISPNDAKAVRLDELGYTDLGDSLEDMKVRAKQRKFDFPYLYDGETQKMSRRYGPRVTPHAFVFDAERKLRFSGRIDDSETGRKIKHRDTRAAIEALLAGKEPPVAKTRVFGCSIKWSDKREANRRFLEKLAKMPVKLEDLHAKDVAALRANKGEKLRLINVWSTLCAPCIAEFPDLVTIDRMYRRREFEFVTITLDETSAKKRAMKFLKKFQASNRNLIYVSEDRDALADALDKKWGGGLPLTLLIKPGGEIAFRHVGRVDPLVLRRKILANLGPWR
jgi:thiol-disulfide isomerase/thioredoxin